MYSTLYLWLGEERLLESTLYIPALAPTYDPARLAGLLAGERGLWLDSLDLTAARAQQEVARREWEGGTGTGEPARPTAGPVPALSPTQRIIRRLESYEARQAGPECRLPATSQAPAPPPAALASDTALAYLLAAPLATLGQMSHQFNINTAAYGSLNCSWL